jgi:acyl-CoA synthetase (AMP-forming)/AMP-acid ligase II
MHQNVVGLVAENSPDYVTRAFACWAAGSVVVPLRSHEDASRIRMAQVTQVLATQSGSGWLQTALPMVEADQPAQILFTSGTEGEPKGFVLTHRNLADTVQRLNAVMQVTAEIREYVGVPVYHSFGFGRCRAVCAAGGAAFIPARGFNPLEINTMLLAGEINAISAVPSQWRILLQAKTITQEAAERVRWIEVGSQSISASEKLALRTLFANACIVQHYGLTEASRSTFLEIHQANAASLGSVGKATGEAEFQIASDGRIMLRGPHISQQLLTPNGPVDPRDGEGWLTTNDLGEIRDGCLFFLGRADDMINCGGLKLSPEALEQEVFASLQIQGELAICRVPDALRGDGILVAVTQACAASDDAILSATLEAAARQGVSARDATHLLRVESLDRTDTGKIQRQRIAQAFASINARASNEPPEAQATVSSMSLRARLGAVLGVRSVADKDTFVNLGGDSLRYIQASLVIEKYLGFLPHGWETQPMEQLDRHRPRKLTLSRLEPSVLLRAIAILAVVVNHAGVFESLFAIDGAAYMLLLPAGYSFARFQLQRVLASGRAILTIAALPRVIVPTLLLLLLQQARHRSFDPSALLFYNNLVGLPVLSFWFIEVFVQIHLVLALTLAVPAVRRTLQRDAWAASTVALGSSLLISQLAPLVWNTQALHNLVPQHLIWYFFLGWCLLFAKHVWQRWVNTAIILCLAVALGAVSAPPDSHGLWIFAGGLFLNWSPSLYLPQSMARVASVLASSSLYIYTSHFLILEPIARLLPKSGYWGPVVGALLVGIAFWYCFEAFWQWGMRQIHRLKTA